MRYPSLGRRIAYIKRELRTKMTLCQSVPFHRLDIFSSTFPFRMFVIIRAIEKIPRTTADQKGKNPGPGECKVPIPSGMETRQTEIEIPNQNSPLTISRKFKALNSLLNGYFPT